MFCIQPFNRIEIYENGDVFNCCPPFINNYKIGNIFENSFDKIWNSDEAKNLRKKILNQDFSLCSDLCNRKINNENNTKCYSEFVNDYPEEISVSSDNTCNVQCKICRDLNYHIEYDRNKLDEEIENIWLPIFKNAKVLRFGCSGEPFSSYKETSIMKKAADTYPNLKFHIHTNGILGNENRLKELNIFERIDTVTLSVHSATFWTYNKIVKNGNYYKVKENMKLYSQMKKNGLINNFRMIFVVYSENYKEMPKFVKLAEKHNAFAEFWALRKSDAKICLNFDKYSLLNPDNKHYKDFIKVLNNKIFDSNNVILYPELQNLRNKSEAICK